MYYISNTPTFNSKKIAFCSILFLLFCFFAVDSMAQTENEKPEIDRAKSHDLPLFENYSRIKDPQNQATQATQNTVTKPTVRQDTYKPEPIMEGERKKIETTPSTMSFNIFLYIVDKFKAD